MTRRPPTAARLPSTSRGSATIPRRGRRGGRLESHAWGTSFEEAPLPSRPTPSVTEEIRCSASRRRCALPAAAPWITCERNQKRLQPSRHCATAIASRGGAASEARPVLERGHGQAALERAVQCLDVAEAGLIRDLLHRGLAELQGAARRLEPNALDEARGRRAGLAPEHTREVARAHVRAASQRL